MNGLTSSAVLWSASSNSSEYISNNSSSSKKYRTMTVQFEITEQARYGTYLDDAVGMMYGRTIPAWTEFFGYKPCLFKDGKVVGYLNPNNYGYFVDGTCADIYSGNTGDVMVEFPRRGIKIRKSGNTVTVSMTDDPNAEGFTYYAHTRGSESRDYFYIGAYLGFKSNGKLRSLSGKYLSGSYAASLSNLRTYASNLGSGYGNVGFYQYLFIQCMYLLQYKGNLDSQTVHGFGANSIQASTGRSDIYGVMFGGYNSTSESGDDDSSIKLFGIEDFWGRSAWFLDGYYVDKSFHILTATDGFNDTGSGYIDHGVVADLSSSSDKSMSGYLKDVVASSELGFTPTKNGTATTSTPCYFYDWIYFKSLSVPCVGGVNSNSGEAGHPGIFFNYMSPVSRDYFGRLCYL